MKPAGCPFHSDSGGISLAEIPGIVRCGDRVRLQKSIEQLGRALQRIEDLDEVKSLALTYVAMVTSATLEMGGDRSLHRIQLQVAREIDQRGNAQLVASAVETAVHDLAQRLMMASEHPSALLIDKALRLIQKRYQEDISDESLAIELGLSTSHFRHLFREATGQPFHKYLVAFRLEQARRLLVDEGLSVSEVAATVGFTGLAHFSRAFTQRFDVSPSNVRRFSISAADR